MHSDSGSLGSRLPLFSGKIPEMRLSLSLAQIATKLGDVESNLGKHLELIQQAKSQKSDLIVFPELSLTGYSLQDLVPSVVCKPADDDPIFRPLLEASRDIDVVVGFVEEDERHRYYVASAYLSAGRVLHVHHKVYLPTYALFDEGRFFTRGECGQGLRYPLRPRRHVDLRGFLARVASVPPLA